MARVALELFATRGFEETTVEDIAGALGVSRRTLFRYFSSKNDIVWGDFDWVLGRLQEALDATSPRAPMMEALTEAVLASNAYPDDQLGDLRIRLTLISRVPALQAHSMLRYQAWMDVIATWVAGRTGRDPDELLPRTVANAALGASMAAFVAWVDDRDADLEANLSEAYHLLRSGFSVPG